MIDGSRPTRTPISLYSRPSASPRDISSRSVNVSITRTAGILSHRTTKIKCYDRLNSPQRGRVTDEVVDIVKPATTVGRRPTVQFDLHSPYPCPGLFRAWPRDG